MIGIVLEGWYLKCSIHNGYALQDLDIWDLLKDAILQCRKIIDHSEYSRISKVRFI